MFAVVCAGAQSNDKFFMFRWTLHMKNEPKLASSGELAVSSFAWAQNFRTDSIFCCPERAKKIESCHPLGRVALASDGLVRIELW